MGRAELMPVFVSRATASALLEISVFTFDAWVASGVIPDPHIDKGQIMRWHWPTIERTFAPPEKDEAQSAPSRSLEHVPQPKGRRRAAA